LDSPFLITSSAGEVARVINRITKLEKVDEWQKKLTQKINSTNRDITLTEQALIEIDNELEIFDDFEDTGKFIRKLEAISIAKQNLRSDYDRINNFIVEVERIDDDILELEEVLKVDSYIDELKDVSDTLEGLYEEVDILENIIELDTDINKSIVVINDLDSYLTELMEVNKKQEALIEEENIIEEFNLYESEFNLYESQELSAIEELSKELKKSKKCPTCFTELGMKEIKRIVENL